MASVNHKAGSMGWLQALKEIQLPRAKRRALAVLVMLAHYLFGTIFGVAAFIGVFLLWVFSPSIIIGTWLGTNGKLMDFVAEMPDVLLDKLRSWLGPAKQAYREAEAIWKSRVLPRNAEVDLSVTDVLVEARPWNVSVIDVPPYSSFRDLIPQPAEGKGLLLPRASLDEASCAWELPQAIVMTCVQQYDRQDVFFFQRNAEGRFEPVSYRHVKPVIDSLKPLKDLT